MALGEVIQIAKGQNTDYTNVKAELGNDCLYFRKSNKGIYVDDINFTEVDGELSETSTNPVANSAITKALLDDEKVIAATFQEIQKSAGLDENAKYVPGRITGATSLSEADDILYGLIQSSSVEVVQTSGTSATAVISQTGVTNMIETHEAKMGSMGGTLGHVTANEGSGIFIEDDGSLWVDYDENTLKINDDNLLSAEPLKELILENEKVTAAALNVLRKSAGFDENGAYESEKFPSAESLSEAVDQLADTVETVSGEVVTVSGKVATVEANLTKLTNDVLDNEEVTARAFDVINTSAGFDEHGEFHTDVIPDVESLKEAVEAAYNHGGSSNTFGNGLEVNEDGEVSVLIADGDSGLTVSEEGISSAPLMEIITNNEQVITAAMYRLNESSGFNDEGEFVTDVIPDVTNLKEAVEAAYNHGGGSENTFGDGLKVSEDGEVSVLIADGDSGLTVSEEGVSSAPLMEIITNNEQVTATALRKLNTSAGFDSHGNFQSEIPGATSLAEAVHIAYEVAINPSNSFGNGLKVSEDGEVSVLVANGDSGLTVSEEGISSAPLMEIIEENELVTARSICSIRDSVGLNSDLTFRGIENTTSVSAAIDVLLAKINALTARVAELESKQGLTVDADGYIGIQS